MRPPPPLSPLSLPVSSASILAEDGALTPRASHACYLVELPAPPGAARGPRIIFDPVFAKRCSPSKLLGPARYTGASASPPLPPKRGRLERASVC